jgi:rod shape determining protein RodA
MNKFLKLDWVLLSSVFLLLALGLLALYSISFDGSILQPLNFEKQIVSIFIGIVLMLIFAFSDYRVLNSYSTKLYFIMLIFLLVVIFLGTTVRGTTGWINFFSYHVQPVEVAKIIMIIFLASFLSKKKTQLSIIVRIIVSIILVFLPVFLILKQPDFGSASIIIGFWAIMLICSGLNKKNLALLFIILFLGVSAGGFFLKDYQKDRIANFVNPKRDPMGSGYNVIQSVVAVGSGKLIGKGLGHGSQSQLNFLPEKHTDFIFAVIAEELGFFGVAAVFILFGVIFWRMKKIAYLARDNFGYLLSIGIIAMIFFQMLVNAGMNIGIIPVAGVPLPFLSYGGSSMVVMLTVIGIMQSVYLRRIKV